MTPLKTSSTVLKNYKSIEEIDQHLNVLRQRADNYKKKTEIHTQLIKHSLTPSNLLAEGITSLSEKYLWQKVFQIVLKKITVKLKK